MDVEKTIQFILETQAKHESKMIEIDARLDRVADSLDRVAGSVDKLAETARALAEQQKVTDASVLALRDLIFKFAVDTDNRLRNLESSQSSNAQ